MQQKSFVKFLHFSTNDFLLLYTNLSNLRSGLGRAENYTSGGLTPNLPEKSKI